MDVLDSWVELLELTVLETLEKELEELDVINGDTVEVDEPESCKELEEVGKVDEGETEDSAVDELDLDRLPRESDVDTTDEVPDTMGIESLV